MESLLWQLPAYYLLVSTAAFIAYWLDKSAAKADRWRIPESRLHLLDLIGGWPGGFAAQRALRHKTRKQPFQTIYWVTVVLHCSLVSFACSPYGGRLLQGMTQ
jgi:uncharacterized membrane protein YsdA (DUF1294 family)